MTILLTAHYLKEFRGTQLFNITLAKEFKRLGHEVFYFTYEKGAASQKLEEYAREHSGQKVDLLIASHESCYRDVMRFCPTRVFISHGVISSLDEPPNDCPVLAVSEEVQEKYKHSVIIRNPIDLERFTPATEGSGILYLASEPQKEMLKILEHYPHTVIGSNADVWDIPGHIQKAAVVVSAARGALEAMACMKPALVYKSTGFDGYCGEYWELNKCNFSGRRYKKTLTPETFSYEMGRATQGRAEANYQYILDNHDSKKIAEQLLRYA